MLLAKNKEYLQLLHEIKVRVRSAQITAVTSVNKELVLLYWEIGRNILERQWYAQQAIKNGWSRNILVHQIESNLYQRQGRITHNFEATLPAPQSDLARQTLKDPYVFDFLSLGEEAQEREIEKELTKHITKFLLELGAGFSFVGSQYLLEISGKDLSE